MPGTLTIRPLKANLRHDKDFFGRMDPYCEFLLGGQKVKTHVCHEGGKHPHWNDSFTLHSNNEATLYVTLKDKDMFTPDDQIGSCQINLSNITSLPTGPQWYPVMGSKGSEGEVLIDISYNPGVQMYVQQPTYAQPSPVYMPTTVQTAYTKPQQTVVYPTTQPMMPTYAQPTMPTMAYQQPTQPAYQPMGYPVSQPTMPTMGAYTPPTQGYAPMGGYGGQPVYRPY